jgi:hypothetical protein
VQTSPAPQSESAEQSAWHAPLTQASPLPQSEEREHPLPLAPVVPEAPPVLLDVAPPERAHVVPPLLD